MSNTERMSIETKDIAGKNVVSSMVHDGLVDVGIPGKTKKGMSKREHVTESIHLSESAFIAPERTPPIDTFRLTTPQKIEFRIRGGSYWNLTQPVLQFTLQETAGAASVTPCKVPFMFSQIQIIVENGASVIQTITDQELWANTQWMTQEKWSTLASQLNTTAAWGAPSAIAANGSK